jgi:hypothetical protein
MTSAPGVFTCGDMQRGQSLIVWAIAEGPLVRRRRRSLADGHDRAPRAPALASPMLRAVIRTALLAALATTPRARADTIWTTWTSALGHSSGQYRTLAWQDGARSSSICSSRSPARPAARGSSSSAE